MDQAAFKQELTKKNNAIVKLIKSRKTRRLKHAVCKDICNANNTG